MEYALLKSEITLSALTVGSVAGTVGLGRAPTASTVSEPLAVTPANFAVITAVPLSITETTPNSFTLATMVSEEENEKYEGATSTL